MLRKACFLALLTLLASLAGVTAAQAEEPLSVGTVDLERLRTEYAGLRQLERQFAEFQQQQQAQLDQRKETRLLTDEERQEFLDRSQMAAPTPEAEQRLAELAALSDEREKRLRELHNKEQRTEEEEAEYQQLNSLLERRMSEIAALQSDLQQSVMSKYDELNKLYFDSLNGAVAAVAEERGLALVVTEEVVLFGGADITDAVLERLNAGGSG
jgi:Skp family chaperone for outer membrane proteins